MSKIVAVQSAFPAYSYSQAEIMNVLGDFWPDHRAVLNRLAETSSVKTRSLVVQLSEYKNLKNFEQRNSIYIQSMVELLTAGIQNLQNTYSFNWEDVGALVSTSITGIAVPSLDTYIMNRFPINRHLTRIPLFGVGCMGGISAINRAHEYLKLYPERLALVMAAEACTLTFQFEDVSMANFVACSLFGDGAAVVLLAGSNHPLSKDSRIEVISNGSAFYPNTERVMGWDIVKTGFKVVLSGSVPEILKDKIVPDLLQFLENNHIKIQDVKNMLSHPGGPKVLETLAVSLRKEKDFFQHSWNSLADHGNLSSVSVLNVIERALKSNTLVNGAGIIVAMGPAFNAEFSLLRISD